MKFENAYQGVKKIFTSELLNLFASICNNLVPILEFMVLLSALGITIFASSASLAFALGSGIGYLVLNICGTVLAVIAFVLQLVGLSQAAKDDRYFKVALIMVICGFCISVLTKIMTYFNVGGTIFPAIMSIAVRLATMLVTLFIVNGIRRLAKKMNQFGMVRFGTVLNVILIITSSIVIIAEAINRLMTNTLYITIVGYLVIIALFLFVIFYIIYLVYLGKAKNMLMGGKQEKQAEAL